jgi:signal peptide peptidase SppA
MVYSLPSHPRILRAITADRWAIQQDALERIVAIAQGLNDAPESLAAKLGRPLDNTRTVTRRGDAAIVPVFGPIFRYANLFTDVSGATSVETLARDFRTAVDDPSVKSVILEIDSPGGQVAGVSEFAEQVRAAASIKPIIAYVSDLGASAAYWIASAASEIVARDTARLGAIGVVLRAVGGNKDEIKFISGQSPNKHVAPDSDAGRAQYQAEVDKLADVFIAAVAEYRGVSVETVANDFGRGGVLVGQEAVNAGLADRLGSLESVIDEINAQPVSRGFPMTTKTTAMTRELLAADHPDLLAALREEGRMLGHAAGLVEGAARERQRIQDVENQALPGHEALIVALKFDGQTTGSEAALQIVRAEKALADQRIASLRADTPKPLPYDEAPPPASAKSPDASVSWDKVMPGHT